MFGNRLKQIRTENNLTQLDLARIIKVSPSTIGMYEQNRRDPDTNTVKYLALHFSVSVDWLLGLTDSRNESISKTNKNDNQMNEDVFDQLGTIINRDAKPLTQKDKERLLRIIESAWPVDDED